ncbi:hypothetical protein DITRI_Ditri01bG0179700 [Diplodiscus trichospermus]
MSAHFHGHVFLLILISILSILAAVLAQANYAKIPDRTIVWYGNRKKPATDRESKVELTITGELVLRDPKGQELWRSGKNTNDSQASHSAMLDTGNFVIVSRNSDNIWESF